HRPPRGERKALINGKFALGENIEHFPADIACRADYRHLVTHGFVPCPFPSPASPEARLGEISAGHSPAGGRGRGQAVFAVFVAGLAGRARRAAGKAVSKSGLKSTEGIS